MRLWRSLRLLWMALFLILVLWLYAVPADSRSGGWFDLAPRLRKTVLALQITPALAAGLSVTAVLTALALILSSLLSGRVFCSLLCPAGMVQEWAHRLGMRLKTSRLRFARPPRRVWIWLAVGICGLWGIAAYSGAALAVDATDPVGLFGRAATVLGELGRRFVLREESFSLPVAMLATAAFGVPLLILLPLILGRWFCDRLCPAGAALGLFADHARRRIALNASECTLCGKCAGVCPMRCIDACDGKLDFSRCVLCLECVPVCPNNAIRYTACKPMHVSNGQPDPARRSFLFPLAPGLPERFIWLPAPSENTVPYRRSTPVRPPKPPCPRAHTNSGVTGNVASAAGRVSRHARRGFSSHPLSGGRRSWTSLGDTASIRAPNVRGRVRRGRSRP